VSIQSEEFLIHMLPMNTVRPSRHILFFAEDADLVRNVFDSAVEFVSRVNIARLPFQADARVRELIG
jgi:hypothetical protein